MLRVLRRSLSAFEEVDSSVPWTLPEDGVWVDLIDPSREEEILAEKGLGIPLPTREEMAEIEVSSRLYEEAGSVYMTATVLTKSDSETPEAAPITFVLTEGRLVTIRYVQPRAFLAFSAQVERAASPCGDGPHIFLGLLDAIVDRVADILENISAEVGATSHAVFKRPRESSFAAILTRLGRLQITNAKARDSLVSLARLIGFANLAKDMEDRGDAHEKLKSLQRDVASLTDHATYVTENITFLLDAATGLISTEQNEIMKIFSIVSVVLMPPTLIGSIYGMNFHYIPELAWKYGYFMSLILMVLSAVVPLIWLRRKGWI